MSRFIIGVSTSNQMDFKEREKRSQYSYPDEEIYQDKNTAIANVIKSFNPKYFYHIFDIDAYVWEPFTVDSQYLLELKEFEGSDLLMLHPFQ